MIVGKTKDGKKIIYGKLKECVDEIWKLIDFDNNKFVDFDFTASTLETDNIYEAFDYSEGWFGCKNITNIFDSDIINIIFGHYGRGGIVVLELDDFDMEYLKEDIISAIGLSTDLSGYGVLDPEDYTIFELKGDE